MSETKWTKGRLYKAGLTLRAGDGVAGDHPIIAEVSTEPEEYSANADRLALCWNAHDALVKALQNVLKVGRGTSGRIILDPADEEAVERALAQAEGK
mgnify:CR=1 FL=1